ncbi:MAG: 2-hydroxychromene-2-carboxylate isomerase [Alphaproteobacteria bacterium]|nr:2-hydroxychromene-2-carboxylate isomerase [Alphaproteobacteria bacterium]
MTKTIDYFFSVNSPWMYLGHARFTAIAKRAGAHVNVKPMDTAKVFPAAGGLPLPQRPKQRQAYRMFELKRWSEFLGIPIDFQPKFARVPMEMASRLVIAADRKELNALALVGFIGKAIWEEERDVSDPETLKAIAAEHGRNAKLLWDAAVADETKTIYDAYTQEAIDRQVFGAPWYVYNDEPFWGQDRLDFLERALMR